MQLNRFTDYSIRVLLYAAINRGQLITMGEVANYYGVSMEHMRKVVHNLAKLGYIKTYKGKNGGFELAHEPGAVNIGKVVRAVEGMAPLIDCEKEGCLLTPKCSLKGVLREAQLAFMHVLEKYTLEHLVKDRFMRTSLGVDRSEEVPLHLNGT